MELDDRCKQFWELIEPVEDKADWEKMYIKLRSLNFFWAPASTKYHGAYVGGLFDHSQNVTKALLELTNKLNLEWTRPISPYIIGLFHDLCKCDQYWFNSETKAFGYTKDTLLRGHGEKSVMIASTLTTLTEEEVVCIRYHMGAFCEKEEWADYTRAIYQYPNVLYTHTADMIASHIFNT